MAAPLPALASPRVPSLLVAALAALTLSSSAAARADLVVFVHRAGGAEVHRELARVGDGALAVAGRREYPGAPGAWWSYELEVRDPGVDGREVRFDSASPEGDVRFVGRLTDRAAYEAGRDEPWLALPEPAFVVDPRLAATLIGPARELSRRARAGGLSPGDALVAVDVLGRGRADMEVVRHAAFEAGGAAWRRFVVRLGGHEFHLLCDEDGALQKVESPDTGMDAVRLGAEDAPKAWVASTSVDDGGWRATLPEPRYRVQEDRVVRVPMRDGVRLAASIARPAAAGRFPTILIRTPYLRASEMLPRGDKFARRGYVLMAQDVRGRGDSEGEFEPLVHEMEDASDTLDWIARQPFSDGTVGMIGSSYVGWVQWFAGMSGNPHLKAIVPIVSPPDIDENFPYEGGVPMLLVAWWAAVMDAQDDDGFLAGMPDLDWDEVLRTLPLTEVDAAAETARPWVDRWLTTPPEDPYWDARRFHPHIPTIELPALHISGWFDGDQPGALLNFRAMRDRGPPSVRDHQYLMMGPWGHAVNLMRRLGPVDFGDEAVIDLDAVCLRFFDRYLLGVPNGFDEEDRVLLFTMGPNRWRRTTDWPPPDTRSTPLYLRSDGSAGRRDGDGALADVAPTGGAAFDEYRYDPMRPRPLPVEFNDVAGDSAMHDHATVADTDDVLDYRSPPLAAPLELTGPFTVTLFVSTDAADTDFAVELFRVRPDGAMRQIAGGIQRLRYRLGPSVNRPVPPGDVAEVTVDAWASSLVMEPGERLHLQVSSTQLPVMARNLNTLEPAATATAGVVARNRVYHGAVRPSRVNLPVSGGTELRFAGGSDG